MPSRSAGPSAREIATARALLASISVGSTASAHSAVAGVAQFEADDDEFYEAEACVSLDLSSEGAESFGYLYLCFPGQGGSPERDAWKWLHAEQVRAFVGR